MHLRVERYYLYPGRLKALSKNAGKPFKQLIAHIVAFFAFFP